MALLVLQGPYGRSKKKPKCVFDVQVMDLRPHSTASLGGEFALIDITIVPNDDGYILVKSIPGICSMLDAPVS